MIIKNAKVFNENGYFEERDVCISGGFFTEPSEDGEVYDASGCYAIPGLIDVHVHGCMGHDFSDADAAGIAEMARFQAKSGVTAICPTTLTLPEEQLAEACEKLSAYSEPVGAEFIGVHLEGPFISSKKTGAQNPAFVVPPDEAMFRRLQKAANGKVAMMTVAPEIEGMAELIEALSREITISLAHTTTDYETAKKAVDKGARQVTHLFNAMPPYNHREPGLIGAAMDCPECTAQLICDNVHIHPSVVRGALRMFGNDRIVMISDSMRAAGVSDGIYDLGGLEVEVKGRFARLTKDGAIAGSVTNLMGCVRTAVSEMDVPLADAVKCASVNPAKSINVFDRRGSITTGKIADLVILNEDLTVKQVYLRGKALS